MKDKEVYNGYLKIVERKFGKLNYEVIVAKDAAMILYTDENDFIYLVRQYRPAVKKYTLELPTETIDKPNLSPLEIILEGLEEECGIRIKKEQATEIGKFIVNSGYDSQHIYLFSASGKSEDVGQKLEESEEIEVVKIKFDEAIKKVFDNEIEEIKSVYLITQEKLRRMK